MSKDTKKQSNNRNKKVDTNSFFYKVSTFMSDFYSGFKESLEVDLKAAKENKKSKIPLSVSNSGAFGEPSIETVPIKTPNKIRKEVKGMEYTLGKVLDVKDGDSFTILTANGKQEVRIYGIDAPELSQEVGNKSKLNLERLILNQRVNCHKVTTDKYERNVCHVNVEGCDIGGIQIHDGLAWASPYSPDSAIKKRYLSLQTKAQNNDKGIWKLKDLQPPWAHRAKQAQEKKESIKRERQRGIDTSKITDISF